MARQTVAGCFSPGPLPPTAAQVIRYEVEIALADGADFVRAGAGAAGAAARKLAGRAACAGCWVAPGKKPPARRR